MASPQISLAMLARSSYRPAGQQTRAEETTFSAEPVRQTVKTSPAVRVDLSDAARSALLGLQEIPLPRPLGAPPELSQANEGPPMNLKPYVEPGSRLNLSI